MQARQWFERLIAALPKRAAELACQQFDEAGVQPGAIVAWLSHNEWSLIAALAECAKRGCVLLPLNWRLAPTELLGVLVHSGAGHLLSTPATQALADAVRQLVQQQAPISSVLQPGPARGVERGDVMLVYTSGTTGQPKGAMHTIESMGANMAIAAQVQGLTPQDKVLSVLPLFHVGGLCIQTLPALAVGAPVLLHERFEPGAWLRAVQHERPSTSLLVPAAMKAIIEHPDWPNTDLRSLRNINSGSQVVPQALIQAFQARGVAVAQVYGSTETGPFSIAVAPQLSISQEPARGWPAPGVQLRLDAQGQLHIKAPNLMRGYHRAEHSGLDEQGYFATGDLAQGDAKQGYRIVGRSKELIISGGENIHPAEIETLVATLPEVAECAVVGLPDERWGEVPVLAVVLKPNQALDQTALQQLLDARLARFKHPRQTVLLPSLPRTALGKVQRQVLAQSLVQKLV